MAFQTSSEQIRPIFFPSKNRNNIHIPFKDQEMHPWKNPSLMTVMQTTGSMKAKRRFFRVLITEADCRFWNDSVYSPEVNINLTKHTGYYVYVYNIYNIVYITVKTKPRIDCRSNIGHDFWM